MASIVVAYSQVPSEAFENRQPVSFGDIEGENELLAVGFLDDRSFVAREGKIGMFTPSTESSGSMIYGGTLDIKHDNGRAFIPKQV